jgi:hypothetical protein
MPNTPQITTILSQEPETEKSETPHPPKLTEHHGDERAGFSHESDDATVKKKPLAFYLAFLGINITILVFSLDATTLAVAIPVGFAS